MYGALYRLIKKYYDDHVWTESDIRAAVDKWISAEEAESILNKPKKTEKVVEEEKHDPVIEIPEESALFSDEEIEEV